MDHYRFAQICWQKYPHPPPCRFAGKSTTTDLLKSADRNTPHPPLQICSNLLSEIPPPTFADLLQICCQICWQKNTPHLWRFAEPLYDSKSAVRNTTHLYRFAQICWQKYPHPTCAGFLKSVTANLLKSTNRNTPSPNFADLLKSGWQKYPHLCRFAETFHWKFAQIYQAEILPHLCQICQNLPLDLLKSATQKYPHHTHLCRFVQIC